MSLALKRAMLRYAVDATRNRLVFDLDAVKRLVQDDGVEASVVWQDMVTAGLVVPAHFIEELGTYKVGDHLDWYVTEVGKEFLQRSSDPVTPDDREGFMKLLRRDPALDPYIEAAVAEALWAYGAGRPIAAIMCLFAAMERMVKAVAEAQGVPSGGKSINRVFVALGNRMEKQAKVMPSVQAFLSSTFPAVRKARNDAAHSADAPDIDKVRVLLCQFVSWYEAAVVLRDRPGG